MVPFRRIAVRADSEISMLIKSLHAAWSAAAGARQLCQRTV
ncbi:MAG: hypothetical protein ACLSBB_17690 [Ruthenibacterium lactatiformans]